MIKFFKSEGGHATVRLEEFEKGCWIDMVNPTDDEVEDVIAFSGIPEEMLKAALDEEETARCERDEGAFMCLLAADAVHSYLYDGERKTLSFQLAPDR